jgi:AraC family transcriptional regulator
MESVSNQFSDSTLKAEWDGITVEYSQQPPGEGCISGRNVIAAVFTPQERSHWYVKGGESGTTAVPLGSICLYSVPQIYWQWEQPAESLHITLAPDLLAKVAADSSVSGVELDHRLIFTDPTILHISHLFKSEVQNGGLAGRLYTESLANVLAVHLLRNYSGLSIQPTLEDAPLSQVQLRQIKDFIEEHLSEELTIVKMAAVVHMSQFHFARVFKTTVGIPPHRYVSQRRMERAKILLSVSRLSVAEVAYRVGFDNKSHFIAQFRKATGTTPKAYRDSF